MRLCTAALLALGLVVTGAAASGLVVTGAAASGCGQPFFTDRVVGGRDALQGKWPWQISIFQENYHICGGSLISSTTVITAAHCFGWVLQEQLIVFLGCQNLTSRFSSPAISRKVKTITIHPKYNGEGTSGDLALIELESPVTFNSYILPICIPPPDQELTNGMMCWVTGWGDVLDGVELSSPFTMQEVDVPLINSSACNDIYVAHFQLNPKVKFIEDDMICAGYPEGKKDACQGDSGGPLTCKFGNAWFLIGIVSWGGNCAEAGAPGVYTHVPSFSSWLHKTLLDVTTTFHPKASTVQPTSSVFISTLTAKKSSTSLQTANVHSNHSGDSNVVNTSTSIQPTTTVLTTTHSSVQDCGNTGGPSQYLHMGLPVATVLLSALRCFIDIW